MVNAADRWQICGLEKSKVFVLSIEQPIFWRRGREGWGREQENSTPPEEGSGENAYSGHAEGWRARGPWGHLS